MPDLNLPAWPVFAGIDWGGENHQLCVVAPDGKRLLETRVSHDVAGLHQLDLHLNGFGRQVPIAIERSEGLLVEHLQATGHAVFPVSPRISARARERYKVAAVKDDRFDAFVLADTLRFDHAHWRPLSVPSPLLAEIKALTRDRDRLLETQQATESQLRMILEAYHPAPVRLFSSVDRQITLSFVTDYPTPANASRVKTTRMAGFLSRHHYTRRVPAQTLADRMRQNLLSGSPGTVAGKSFSALAFTQVLQLLNTQLAEYDDAIAAATAEHPDALIFASFPGIGPVLTAVLLAEIGEDRARFPQPEVLLAEAGLAPVTRSSGRSRSVRFRYAANSRLREATMWWAFNSIKMSPWAAAAFRDARDQKGQRYHRALRGLAARWTRILRRCWTNHETYDPARHGSAALITAA
ncbi:IS110 family transposase [Microbacterium lacticum]